MKRNIKFSTLICCVLAALVISSGVTAFTLLKCDMSFSRLRMVERIIEECYVEDFDSEEAENAAIKAVVESTDDKYGAYYDEESAKDTFDFIEGTYIGIGIEVFANAEADAIEVIAAYDGSAGMKAGIKPGDIISKIDGKKYGAKEMDEAINYIRGTSVKNPIGTKVEITLIRDGEEIALTMVREKVALYRVESNISDSGVCYIKYSGFTVESENKFEELINNIKNNEAVCAIVLDLRNNPGGDFGSAIKMCDAFLDDGCIMYTMDKKGNKTVYNAKKGACDLPLAVLVNGSTASAAEIVAGCLKARGRAVIVGTDTFGKGVSQTVVYINPLKKADGALKITTHKNFTPDGRWISDKIIPDVICEADKSDNIYDDSAYNVAVDNLLKKDLSK